ncbi:MAG: branched-chain amino acid ABC transporter permease [Burkholderiaceae bacterium]|nr:branched-chain amino acid ABC transporter permease [Burkholderiaceae bacterium]
MSHLLERPAVRSIATIVAVLALLLLPFGIENYWLRVWTSVLMYVGVAQGLNIIVGFAGYHSFGNAAFFGIGAYCAAILLAAGWTLPAALGASIVLGAILAAVLGWPLLRLRGHYFAIATVALNIALAELVLNMGVITGGAQGIAMPMPSGSPEELYQKVYLLMLGGAIAATAIVAWLARSRFGYALRASKDSESGARAMGINTTRVRVLGWMLSAAVTAYVGAVWAYWMNFIEVTGAFDIGISLKGYIMMLMGGMGSVLGPALGAVFFETVATLVWSRFGAVHNLMLGVLVCLVVLFLPKGFAELLRVRRSRRGVLVPASGADDSDGATLGRPS